MAFGWHLSLRRRWSPPPAWPRPASGFIPASDWTAPSDWPPPPPGWNLWKAPRARLLTTVGLALLSALTAVATLRVAHTADRSHALSTRGVAVTAHVIDSHYDPGGGDPNGWTNDHVSFTDRSAQLIHVTVGHHNDNHVEQATGSMTIVYDPRQPTDAAPTSSALVTDNSQDIPPLIGAAVTALLAISSLLVLASALRITRT